MATEVRLVPCPLLELCTDDTLLLIACCVATAEDLLRLALTCRRFAAVWIAAPSAGGGPALPAAEAAAAAAAAEAPAAEPWSLVEEAARRWLVTRSQGCGWIVRRIPHPPGLGSWLGVMHSLEELGDHCASCAGLLGLQCYRIHHDRGLGCADGLCVACFRSQRSFLCVGDDAPRGYGAAAYSHRMIGCVSHTGGSEMDDDDGADLPGVFYFCDCHEGPGGAELRRELAGVVWSDLCQRLRDSGALAPALLVPLTPAERALLSDVQKSEYERAERRDEETLELLDELCSGIEQRDHIIRVLAAHAATAATAAAAALP
jgi:hypothetical protein